jgi:hypothetical protein
VTINVTQASTTTTIAISSARTANGTVATISASVAPQIGGKPTGTVVYLDGNVTLGSAPVGTSFITGSLSPGTHELWAVYTGDANFTLSSSTQTPVVASDP